MSEVPLQGLVRFRLRDFTCTRRVHLKRFTPFTIVLKPRSLEVSKLGGLRPVRPGRARLGMTLEPLLCQDEPASG